MTIINMTGGGGEEITTSTYTGDLIAQIGSGSVKSIGSLSSTSYTIAVNVINDYVKEDIGTKTYIRSDPININIKAYGGGYEYYSYSVSAPSTNYDTVTPYLKSICPEGKTFTATLTSVVGFTHNVNAKPSSLIGSVFYKFTASGDKNNVSYSMPTFNISVVGDSGSSVFKYAMVTDIDIDFS